MSLRHSELTLERKSVCCKPILGGASQRTRPRSNWARARRTVVWTSFLLLTLTPGCHRFQRLSECDLAIETVNFGLSRIHESLPDAGETSAEAYRQVAIRYAELGDELSRLNIRDHRLRVAIDSYREVLSRADNRALAYATTLELSRRGKKARAARRKSLRRQEDLARGEVSRQASTIRKLNELCHPH